jgi:hypothetical protein
VLGGWRRLYLEELRNFYASSNIVRLRWPGHVACMGEIRNSYKILFGKHEGRRPR